MKNKCPCCPKEFQSEKDLERHCLKYHNSSLVNLKKPQTSSIIFVGGLGCGKTKIILESILNGDE